MKSYFLCFAALSLVSCSSIRRDQYDSQKLLSGTVSISNDKCDFVWKPQTNAHCSLSRNESEPSSYILQLEFPRNFFSIPPSCIFQDFKLSKPGLKKQKIEASISLISSSEVRIETTNLKPEYFKEDLAFSFICLE